MGMKPYYTAKQIDGEGFVERLKNIGTMNYYDKMVPEIKPTTDGHKIWMSEQDYDPWEALAGAIISAACKEYAEAYVCRDKAHMENLETWFLDIEYARPVFFELQYQLRNAERRGLYALRYLVQSIRVLW